MRSTRQMSITLPQEMADLVKSKVACGQYASESEVIRDGLRALAARDQAIEHWLRTTVAAEYDRVQSNESEGRTSDQVRTILREAMLREQKSQP